MLLFVLVDKEILRDITSTLISLIFIAQADIQVLGMCQNPILSYTESVNVLKRGPFTEVCLLSVHIFAPKWMPPGTKTTQRGVFYVRAIPTGKYHSL